MPSHTIITVPYYLISYPSLLQSFNWSGSISAFSISKNRRKVSFSAKILFFSGEQNERGALFFFCPALLCNFMFSCPHFPLKCLRYYRPHTNSCILKSLSTSNQYSPLHTSVVVPPQSNGPVYFRK